MSELVARGIWGTLNPDDICRAKSPPLGCVAASIADVGLETELAGLNEVAADPTENVTGDELVGGMDAVPSRGGRLSFVGKPSSLIIATILLKSSSLKNLNCVL